jgi:hypothetical protein
MPNQAHCPYCDRDVQISSATDLADAIDDGRDRSGWYLLTHWQTPTLAHQWTAPTAGPTNHDHFKESPKRPS